MNTETITRVCIACAVARPHTVAAIVWSAVLSGRSTTWKKSRLIKGLKNRDMEHTFARPSKRRQPIYMTFGLLEKSCKSTLKTEL